jgi:hypothetical protein
VIEKQVESERPRSRFAEPNVAPTPDDRPGGTPLQLSNGFAGSDAVAGESSEHPGRLGNQAMLRVLGADQSSAVPPATGAQKSARVTTPPFPPPALPPASYPPQNERMDTEGNPILVTPGGRPYLARRPARLVFPYADGADYRLLPVNPNRAYQRLREQCGRLLIEQRQLAERLKGDMKYWFARVYSFVTQYTLEDIDAGKYQYPHMKMQQIIHFHETYERNLAAWEAGQRSKVESNWRAAFAAAEEADSWLGMSWSIGNALLPSMEAHIRLDLPRAMAAAYHLHYADIPGSTMDAFERDFFAMGSVFERSQAAIAPEIEEAGTDVNPLNWETFADVGFVFLFQIDAERRMAWEKAAAIARVWGMSREVIERSLRAEMGARHPNREPFEVDDADITDYDWGNQPGARPDMPAPGPTHPPAPQPPNLGALHFRLDHPRGDESLEHAVRRDQDLEPLLALADWTREVRGASIWLLGRASSEGSEVLNTNLSLARAELVRFFLWRAGADLERNVVHTIGLGAAGSQPSPDHRCVLIWVGSRGYAKRQIYPAVGNLPSELAP